MRRTILLVVAVALVAFVVAGCGGYSTPSKTGTGGTGSTGSSTSGGGSTSGGTGTGGSTSSAPAQKADVTIADFAFNPPDVTLAVGGTVTFTNDDSTAHTVTGEGWDSGNLDPGKTFSKTFDKAGTYDYKCSIHPSMTGSVTVK